MKKLLFIFMLFPLIGFTQLIHMDSIMTKPNTITNLRLFTDTTPLLVASIRPTHSIVICGTNKKLTIDFNDTLIVTGDMDMDEAAKKFINYCKAAYTYKIDSLETIISELNKQNKR